MKENEQFETLWNDYLEGALAESGMADLQRLLESDENALKVAADSFQMHRLLGLKAEDSESRHEEFVRATMAKLPSSEADFVDDVMGHLQSSSRVAVPARPEKPFRNLLLSAMALTALLLIGGFLFLRNSAPSEVVRITALHGNVRWTGDGGIVQELNNVGHVLHGGTLETQSADAWANLEFRDGTVVTVSGRSLLTLSEQDQKVVRLRYGNVSANVAPQPAGRPMLVYTPSANLSVLGTQFNLDAQPEATRLVVNEGRVRLKRTTDGEEVDVDAQQEVTASIEDDSGLVPLQRAEATSVWKSDLKSEVVYGKWVPEFHAVAMRLKKAIAKGQITKSQAMDTYKEAATLDENRGSVWALPTESIGSLVVLSVSRSSPTPVVLTRDAKLRIRGRLHSPKGTSNSVEFGITVHDRDAGFAGKYSTSVPFETLRGDSFDLEVPVSDLQVTTGYKGSLIGRELRDWWCVSKKTKSAKLEIFGVELISE